jgi:hypothetical protein
MIFKTTFCRQVLTFGFGFYFPQQKKTKETNKQTKAKKQCKLIPKIKFLRQFHFSTISLLGAQIM